MADGITRIAVEGFKSIAKRQEIEIRPLTILAGANSSGKSAIMQPLLMLKQTLEATYDPGPLKIDGPNVTFTSSSQFFYCGSGSRGPQPFEIEIRTLSVGLRIKFVKREVIAVQEETYYLPLGQMTLRPDMSRDETAQALIHPWNWWRDKPVVEAYRCFLLLKEDAQTVLYPDLGAENVIHVPGLRRNPSRTYQHAATGPNFPGTFEHYTASLILHWQSTGAEQQKLLNCDLAHLGVAGGILAKRLNEVELDLLVNRLAGGESDDLVSIADVGSGVSQVLPVLVALRAAESGRLVYLEEPEIHLHPRAQTKLADILAGAAKRGVRVVAETHSSLLLRAIQTLVAKGALDRDLVIFHWFARDAEGVTQVSSAELDANGAFGDWPEDFGDVALRSEQEYLDAVEDRLTR